MVVAAAVFGLIGPPASGRPHRHFRSTAGHVYVHNAYAIIFYVLNPTRKTITVVGHMDRGTNFTSLSDQILTVGPNGAATGSWNCPAGSTCEGNVILTSTSATTAYNLRYQDVDTSLVNVFPGQFRRI